MVYLNLSKILNLATGLTSPELVLTYKCSGQPSPLATLKNVTPMMSR